MSIINTSNQLYGENAADTLAAFILLLDADAIPTAFDLETDITAEFGLILGADAAPRTTYIFGFDGDLILNADANPSVQLILTDPPPILDTITGGFVRGKTGKLYADGVEIPYRRATLSKPKNSLGASFEVDLARADLAYLPNNAVFRFEVGSDIVFDSAKLETRNLSRSWSNNAPNDSLSFSTLIDIEDKFILAPRRNIICFDKNKTSVDVANIEKLRDTDGVLIPTITRSFNGLNLYQLLKIAFVEICGFTAVVTNIPNYPLTRCDFNISQPAKESVAPFIGNFKPEYIALPDGSLRILNGKQTVPNDFTPTIITADTYSGIGIGKQSKAKLDGLRLVYQSSGEYTTFLINIKPSTIIETGEPFSENYTKQTITETYVDFYDLYYPDSVTKEDLIERKTVTTNFIGFTISQQIETFTVDLQGKTLKTEKSESSKIPLPENGFTSSLKEFRATVEEYEYQTDITNSRNVIPKTVKQTVSEIIATDSDNQYFGNDFPQKFSAAHEAGNLTDSMNYSSFPQPVETYTKVYTQIGNGQIRVVETKFNVLRGEFIDNKVFETASGDPSFNNSFSKPRELVKWRDGVNKLLPGKPLPEFPGGEIPLFFLIPLVERELSGVDDLQSGSVNIEGYNAGLERGQLLKAMDRDGTTLGKYVVSGFSVSFEFGRTQTSIEVDEVL